MDGNISKALWLGVSILLFIAVVTIGLSVFSSMKEVSNAADDKIGSVSQSLSEEDFRRFEGEAKGDEVLQAIGEFSGRSGEVIVLVATLGKNNGNSVPLNPSDNTGLSISQYEAYVSRTGGTLSSKDKCVILSGGTGKLLESVSKTLQDAARRDAENSNLTGKYINPSGKFVGYQIYDANQTIIGVIFAQVE